MNSPFLHFPSLELEVDKDIENAATEIVSESPFLSNTRLNGERLNDDPKSESLIRVMDELYDEEFEEAIDELLSEAEDIKESVIQTENYFTNEYQSRNTLQQYYLPLNRETDRFFNQLIQNAEQVDQKNKDVEELENFLEKYTTEDKQITDIQDNFLGGLKKLAGKVVGAVKKGVSTVGKLAKKFGLGFLFNKLKKIAFKFLKGFLNKGIKHLPANLQGTARNLADKIMPKSVAPVPASTSANGQANSEPATEPAEAAQQELNAAVAHLLTANNEMEWELIERELDNDASISNNEGPDLSSARQQFIKEISQLEHNANPEPQVEQFVMVILTALKFIIPILGREKVMNWLSSLISKLIEKFIGKETAIALSKQMVAKGFSMLNLEHEPEDAAQIGAGAIAETVEDTVRQLEHFPAYVFEDRPLFERHVVEAFEQAAAVNLPDILSESVYKKFPLLRESNRRRLLWKLNRRSARDHRRQLKVKSLNEVIETEITPFIANEVRSFGGVPLSTFLRDRMGVEVTKTIPVRMHLFEALPESRFYHLAKYAEGIPGMQTTNKAAWMQFHPLTSVASGLLLGEPGLGCRSSEKCLSKHKNAGGHRFYYMEVPGARPQFFSPRDRKPVLRAITCLKGKLDFMSNEIRLKLYLSEADAQAIATSVRKNQAETAHVLLSMILEQGLKNLFSYGQFGNLKILHTNVIPGKRSGLALDMLPPVVVNALRQAIKLWAGEAMIGYLRNQADQFVQAAEHEADGVMLNINIISPPDFTLLRQMLIGAGFKMQESLFTHSPADVLVIAKPGSHA
jgi:hypothetical protein